MSLRGWIYCALTLAASAQVMAADRFAQVEVKAQHVRGHVHMLTGAGGNIGVSIGDDGTLIIDDQFAPLSEKILAALQKLGGGRPAMILNTHVHGDHTGGNPFFGETGTIIAHDNVRTRLAAQQAFPSIGLPKITYQQQLQLHINSDTLRVSHLPRGIPTATALYCFNQRTLCTWAIISLTVPFPLSTSIMAAASVALCATCVLC